MLQDSSVAFASDVENMLYHDAFNFALIFLMLPLNVGGRVLALPLSPRSDCCSGSVPSRNETAGAEEPTASSDSVPDVCHGDVQSGISGAREGPSAPISTVSSWSGSTSDWDPAGGGRALPGNSVSAMAAISAGALSDVTSSKGSKMRGRASDDMVPSVASSWDSGTTVSAVINAAETKRSGHEAGQRCHRD